MNQTRPERTHWLQAARSLDLHCIKFFRQRTYSGTPPMSHTNMNRQYLHFCVPLFWKFLSPNARLMPIPLSFVSLFFMLKLHHPSWLLSWMNYVWFMYLFREKVMNSVFSIQIHIAWFSICTPWDVPLYNIFQNAFDFCYIANATLKNTMLLSAAGIL